MKKLLMLMAAFGVMFYLSSCGDDDDGDDPTPPAGGLSISGIPANASLQAGATLTVNDVNLTFEDGFGSFELVVNEGDPVSLDDLVTDQTGTSATITITFPTDVDLIGTNTLEFTLTDSDNDQVSVTHTLVVGAILPTFTVIGANENKGPDEDDVVEYVQNQVTGVINTDFTFTNDVVWLLNGRVIVDNGATLTIEPGTIVKGSTGQGALSSVLLVAIGGMLDAQGTAQDPIVFTSVNDNINIAGQPYFNGTSIIPGTDDSADGFTSTLDVDIDRGLWGGVVILGDAPVSADAATPVVEGIPTTVPQAVYGGTNAAHNGGSLTYASIRFTGTQLGPGNELQGLTLGGVGSGTTINHVESIASADDGIEIFGGTVNITNFIVWGQDDDAYDVDQAWTGLIDNFVAVGGVTPASAFELDGPEGAATGTGRFINGTIQGGDVDGTGPDPDTFANLAIDLRDDAVYDIQNVYFFDFNDEFLVNFNDNTPSQDNYTGGETILANLEFAAADFAAGRTIAELLSNVDPANDENRIPASTAAQTAFGDDASIVTTQTVGADLSGFGWSYTSVQGKLDPFTSIE